MIRVAVRSADGASLRSVELPGHAWPLQVGCSAECAVRLEGPELGEDNALIERRGVHNYVRAGAGAPVKVAGRVITPGSRARFDAEEVQVGPFVLQVTF